MRVHFHSGGGAGLGLRLWHAPHVHGAGGAASFMVLAVVAVLLLWRLAGVLARRLGG